MFKKVLFLCYAIAVFCFTMTNYIANAGSYATVINLDTGHRKAVEIGSVDAFAGNYVLEVASGYSLIEQEEGMLGFSVASGYKEVLSASMTATQTTVPVVSMVLPDDHTLTMADLGDKVFLTLEPSSSKKKEIVMCTGISGSNWTGCTRGLAFYGTSTASVADNREKHSSGSIVIMSNVHYVYDELMDKDTTETITGDKTFSGTVDFSDTIPTMPTTAPTTDDQVASKSYVDGVAIAGAATSTETTAGIGELATATEQANNTFSATNPTFLSTKYSSSTSGANYVIVADSDGELDSSFIGDNDYTFSGENTFSGTTTMATTTITDLTVSGATDFSTAIPTIPTDAPTSDDEVASKKYVDDYDNIATGQGSRAKGSTGTQAITHGLGRTPRYIQIQAGAQTDSSDQPFAGSSSFGTATGTGDETSTGFYSHYNSGIEVFYQDATHIISLRHPESTKASATLSAISSTTFTLNWDANSNASDDGTRYFQWTVY